MIARTLSYTVPVVLNGNGHHHPMDGWTRMGGWWMWFIILIAVFLIILLIYLIMSEDKKGENRLSNSNRSAEKILDERYARGEITTEEYKEMRTEMRK